MMAHSHGAATHNGHGPTTTGRLALSSLVFGLNFLVQGRSEEHTSERV